MEYQTNDCARCHTTCATCHFQSSKTQALPGNVVTLWDSLQNFGNTGALARAEKMIEYALDWTTNVESHAIFTDDSLKASNTVCRSCHSGYYQPPASGFLSEAAPYPKAMATEVNWHPQVEESAQSSKHQGVTCATCHSDVHSYPGREFDWQKEGDARCEKCHQLTNHYSQHKTVDCIACHATGLAKSKGQNGHDVWRLHNKSDGRVRPLAVKYNEAINYYPHHIVKPDNSTCASRCHYAGNLLGATVFPSAVTDIAGVPLAFTLKQNYPNPFNPHTNINFTLPNRNLVEIQIYDVLGNWITTLLRQQLEAGDHQLTWNGQDQNGTELASGIYVVTIKADHYSASKKMLKLK
ncbi:T9SS type A sorting domain-containing protein [candidate division KSB1 bacterium]|nr:T9SS type A sorting domain-containing protein [candidate division KSB1 bacterium]